jgi:hypothetical protein
MSPNEPERNEGQSTRAASRSWERPEFELICLACEISAYAPDEGEPLF